MLDKKVRDLMARKPVALRKEDTLATAKEAMVNGRIRHLPVVENESVVGVISQRDLYRVSLGSGMQFDEDTQKEFLKTVVAKNVMSHPAVTVIADAPIREAVRTMIEKRIGCLPVLDDGKFVGLITDTDLLKLLLEL